MINFGARAIAHLRMKCPLRDRARSHRANFPAAADAYLSMTAARGTRNLSLESRKPLPVEAPIIPRSKDPRRNLYSHFPHPLALLEAFTSNGLIESRRKPWRKEPRGMSAMQLELMMTLTKHDVELIAKLVRVCEDTRAARYTTTAHFEPTLIEPIAGIGGKGLLQNVGKLAREIRQLAPSGNPEVKTGSLGSFERFRPELSPDLERGRRGLGRLEEVWTHQGRVYEHRGACMES